MAGTERGMNGGAEGEGEVAGLDGAAPRNQEY